MSLRSQDVISRTLPAAANSPAEARALIDALPLALSVEQHYDMRLALSELVANSVLHGSRETDDVVGVRITTTNASIRCEVSDQGPGFDVSDRRPAVPDAAGGLGLVLVDRLAARWGTDRGGRTVWFEVDRAA